MRPNIDLRQESLCSLNRTWCYDYLTATDLLAFYATQQDTHVVSSFTLACDLAEGHHCGKFVPHSVQFFVEHFCVGIL